jgi:hypothetical protein
MATRRRNKAKQPGWKEAARQKVKERSQGGRFKLVEGDNIIRILPNKLGTNEAPFLEFQAHGDVGKGKKFLTCGKSHNGKSCYVCKKISSLERSGKSANVKKATGMAIKEQMVLQVAVVDEDTGKWRGPYTWYLTLGGSKALSSSVLRLITSKRRNYDDPKNGFNIAINRTGAGLDTRYGPPEPDMDASEVPEEILAKLKSLEEIAGTYDAAACESAYTGKEVAAEDEDEDADEEDSVEEEEDAEDTDDEEDDDDDEDDEDDEDEDETPPPKRAKKKAPPKRAKKKPAQVEEDEDDEEDDDDEDDDEGEDEEETPPPKKKRTATKTAPAKKAKKKPAPAEDDDESDDEDEEETPPPKKKSRKKKPAPVEEDDDEDEEDEDDADPDEEDPDDDEDDADPDDDTDPDDDDEDEDDDEDDDDPPPPRKVRATKPAAKKKVTRRRAT